MARREALARASIPWPETARTKARFRLLARILRGKEALIMLLQTPAAAQWQVTLKADLTELKAALPHLLRELPDPMHDAVPWLQLISDFPIQWKKLMRRFSKAKVL